MLGKTARGASSPAKPDLTIPDPLSHTSADTSPSSAISSSDSAQHQYWSLLSITVDTSDVSHVDANVQTIMAYSRCSFNRHTTPAHSCTLVEGSTRIPAADISDQNPFRILRFRKGRRNKDSKRTIQYLRSANFVITFKKVSASPSLQQKTRAPRHAFPIPHS